MSDDHVTMVRPEPYNFAEVEVISATTTEDITSLKYKPDEVLIYNSGTDDIYVGFEGVADSTHGFLIKAGNSLTFTLRVHNLHVTASTGTSTVYVIASRWINETW